MSKVYSNFHHEGNNLSHRNRHGLTILEVMIATTLTMLILLALTTSFKRLSDAVSIGRTRVTLSDQLRGMLQTLNSDLALRTVGGETPEQFGSGRGYFKYLDGGMSDWSATVVNSPGSTELAATGTDFKKEDLLRGGSRWGDVDDILMFTAQAKDGQLFRGKIPRALMMYANWNAFEKANTERVAAGGQALPNNQPLPTDDDWAEDISISSEFAEIIWFAIPLNLNDAGLYEPSTHTILASRGQIDNFMPRRMALCRRVLLVRPDLDIRPPTQARVYRTSADERLFYMQPINPGPVAEATSAYESIKAPAYQRCDLSVTVESVLAQNGANYICYKTNSLSDLQDPHNRFAHGIYPIFNNNSLIGATLPLMMLTSGINAVSLPTCQAALNMISSGFNPTFSSNGGFIPPMFMRAAYRRVDPTNWRTWVSISTLQEMVTPDILAFDLKAFDPSAPVLIHPGPDTRWGNALVDDDGDNTVDNQSEAGWFGSDDVTVDPSQPGFWSLLADTNNAPIEVERGAYVDLGWAFRGLSYLTPASGRAAFLVSEYSGMSSTGVSPFLIHGGAISMPTLGNHSIRDPLFIFQNSFDTFTTQYDTDGQQDALGPVYGTGARFRFSKLALGKYMMPPPPIAVLERFDPDGVDVPPAYPSELRSIQATIRIQDRTAQAMQQISVIHSLVD